LWCGILLFITSHCIMMILEKWESAVMLWFYVGKDGLLWWRTFCWTLMVWHTVSAAFSCARIIHDYCHSTPIVCATMKVWQAQGQVPEPFSALSSWPSFMPSCLKSKMSLLQPKNASL
jgi:hypothetical protein